MQPASSTMSGSDDTRVLLSAIQQSAKKMVGTKSKQQFISNNTHLFFIIVLSAVVSFDCKSILRLWLSTTDKHFTDDTFLPDYIYIHLLDTGTQISFIYLHLSCILT